MLSKLDNRLIFDQYKADISKNGFPKKKGVSGIMRVKNDAEFIEASIESCVSALDELIIVYNDCTDNTPAIIRKMQDKYPDIIRSYEYKPKIYSVGLTEEEFNYAKSLPNDSINLLANYYNFALTKVSYEFVLKIDADQIYYTDTLKRLLNAYRGTVKETPNLKSIYSFVTILSYLIMNKILSRHNINSIIGKHFIGYQKTLLWLVKWFKIPLSLSGVNVFYYKRWYVTLGDINDNLNILPPYNGVGDHIVFKISKKTRYVPYILPSYSLMTSTKYSIIEKFVGVKSALPYGFLWFHMNSMRRAFYDKQVKNFKLKSTKYKEIDLFWQNSFSSYISEIPLSLFSERLRGLFNLLHNGSVNNIPLDFLKRYVYTNDYKLQSKL